LSFPTSYPRKTGMKTTTHPTEDWPVHARFDGPIVMIGFGSIGKGTLPLIERHIAFDRSKLVVIAPDDEDRALLDERKIQFVHVALTKANYRDVLTPLLTLGPGRGLMVNLSVDTSSVELMEFARDINAFYIDTVVEPWPGLYTDRTLSPSARSNYALRESVLELRRRRPGGITAVSCCGANPGMVSWMVKCALLDIVRDIGIAADEPRTRDGWAQLMQRAGVKGIHIAERDTQRSRDPKPHGTFVNTWSVEGFISEGMQPSELGWGTHEKTLPPRGHRHDFG
jgi:homospermidine synthase